MGSWCLSLIRKHAERLPAQMPLNRLLPFNCAQPARAQSCSQAPCLTLAQNSVRENLLASPNSPEDSSKAEGHS